MAKALRSPSLWTVRRALVHAQERGWRTQPNVRAALAVMASKHPEPSLRARAKRALARAN